MTDDEFLDRAQAELEFLKSLTVNQYQVLRLPSSVDLRLVGLCDIFKEATQTQREVLVSALDAHSCYILLVFVERMAMLAARQNSAEVILTGILAILMIDDHLEAYDLLMVLSLPYRSALKIGLDPRQFFTDALQYSVDPSVSELVKGFLQRSPEDQSIVAMGYREFLGPKGVVYWFGKEPIPAGLLGGGDDTIRSPS